jgi:hypothetical protein
MCPFFDLKRAARGRVVDYTSDAAEDGHLLAAILNTGYESRSVVGVGDITRCVRLLLDLLTKFVLAPV